MSQTPSQTTPEPPPTWLTVAEAAHHARVSEISVRRWLRTGKLTPHRPDGRVRRPLVNRQELDAFIAASAAPARDR